MRNTKMQIDKSIFTTFDDIMEKYAGNVSEDNLNQLLELYERVTPNWVHSFNVLSKDLQEQSNSKSREFSDFFSLQLPKNYSVKHLKAPKNKTNDIGKDIMQRGRIIHLSNKLAHQFEYIFDSALKGYMTQNDMMPQTPEEFYDVKKLVRQMYNPRTNEKIKQRARDILMTTYEFQLDDFEIGKNLDALPLPELIKAYNDAMYIKASEIENVNALAHNYDRQDISYGLKKDDDSKTLFVMDVQGFGQFSVHVVDPNLIAQIKRKYKMPLYRKKTAMLVNAVSAKTKEFIQESKEDASMDEERRIPKNVSEARKRRLRLKEEIMFLDLTKAEKHELAVKGGLRKQELEEIDNAEEERW